ncbi:MAG: hypothetical protein ABR534_09965 [Desulfotignum sp.]|nr:hypothetical protein [Desulfobacteraceae bacterium]
MRAKNAGKYIGFHFAGMRWFKITAPGIVKYVIIAEIGVSGIARTVTDVPMESLCHAKIATAQQFTDTVKSKIVTTAVPGKLSKQSRHLNVSFSFIRCNRKHRFWENSRH